MDAPYTGGFSPGDNQFAVDGDFTSCDPCGPPKISFPLKGDSVFSSQDVLFYATGNEDYVTIPLGEYPNLSPWSPSQAAFIIEQDFMVAEANYIPLALNTSYDGDWAIGWQSVTSTNYPLPNLTDAILIEEGPLEDMGQGIVKFTRRFATIPPTRNDVEQFVYTFPGYDASDSNDGYSGTRLQYTRNVISRLQYDYFIFDDLDILSTPIFPNGNRLDATTGLYPNGLLLPSQYFYSPVANAFEQNIFLPPDSIILTNAPSGGNATAPSADDWINWLNGVGTSNGQPPELIAEPSTMQRYMGNIYVRRTRFVLVQ